MIYKKTMFRSLFAVTITFINTEVFFINMFDVNEALAYTTRTLHTL